MGAEGGRSDVADATRHFQTDVAVAMELVGDKAVLKMQALSGPQDPDQAKAEAPRSIRAIYGTDSIRNAIHCSANQAAAEAEIDFFFGPNSLWQTTAIFNNCTCLIVRPHAMRTSGGDI